MKVTRYVNQQKIEGVLPPLLVKNQGIIEVIRHHPIEKSVKVLGKVKGKEL
ncbi:MAG: hypothetical protein R3Y63_03950 [Eubacteriales bacterium]